MTSTTVHSTDLALLDEPDRREKSLLAHPSWQFPTLFSRYKLASGTAQEMFHSVLQEREQTMGIATLPAQSILLLFHILEQRAILLNSRSFLWHTPTITAREKQLVLPRHVTVLKTVTVMMSAHIFLWTTVGDRIISRTELHHIADQFGLSKTAASRSIINPPCIDPENVYALKLGMVSPFLAPGRPTPLSAVIFANLYEREMPTEQQVAISLSRYESFLVPYQHFPQVLQEYARYAYPQPLLELSHVHARETTPGTQ